MVVEVRSRTSLLVIGDIVLKVVFFFIIRSDKENVEKINGL